VKKTILQVIPNLGAGGAEQASVDMVDGLHARGWGALVVSAGGARVEEIERLGGRHYEQSVNSKNPAVILKNAVWLALFIRKKRVDIVHARSRAPAWSVWLACLMTGTPFVTTFHAAYKFSHPLKQFYNRVMTRGARIIAISQYIADHIAQAYGVEPAKVRVVLRGIDLEKFSPEDVTETRLSVLRRVWGVSGGQRVVLCPARLSPIKGHRLFIEAMGVLGRGFEDVMAVIVGDDQGREAYRSELQEMIRSNGLEGKVKIVSHCADMPAAYRLASVAVVPSLVPEGFGRVPVEAMAMGVPVIASDLGATRETVREGVTGWLLPPENPKAWAAALAHALALPDEDRARMAHVATEEAWARFDRKAMIAGTLAVYEEMLANV